MGSLAYPQNPIFGPDGNLYVADERTIVELNGKTGAHLQTITAGGLGTNLEPVGLTFGPDGNLYAGVYIVTTGDAEVLEYNPSTGALIRTLVSADSGGLVSAHHIQFGPDGDLYVTNGCDFDNVHCGNDILRFNGTTGAFIDSLVAPHSGGLVNPDNFVFEPSTSTPEPSTLASSSIFLVLIALLFRRRMHVP